MADEYGQKTIDLDRPEYPKQLKETETALLRTRRGLKENDPVKQAVGIGLSGGGIRSATFCLGIFQGLAKENLLSKIDYLSTVSGGGYFGAFYGRLFTRKEIKNTSDVEDILAVRAANQEEAGANTHEFPKQKVFRWLRENGRYLAPSGSGDVLLGGAAMLRNFVAVHLVLWTFILMIFLVAQLIRGEIEVLCRVQGDSQCGWWTALQELLVDHSPEGKGPIGWSPYIALVGVLFLVFVVPPAWCYWLVEKPNRRTAGRWIPPFWGWFAVVVLSVIGIAVGWPRGSEKLLSLENEEVIFWVAVVVFVIAAETMIWGLFSGYVPRFTSRKKEPNDKLIFDDEKVRLKLSLQLRTALVATGVMLAFAVIDSIAQTLYSAALLGQFHPGVWITTIFGPLIALAGLARTIVSAFPSKTEGCRFKVPITLLAGVAAFIITTLILITIDVVSYSIAWENKMPLWLCPDWTIAQRESQADLLFTFVALAITFLFSFLFGWSWPFLNRSTHQSIYTSRLIRAYLGASNPRRLKEGGNVTETIADDDISQEAYWPRFRLLRRDAHSDEEEDKLPDDVRDPEQALFRKGMPLHLVNVTINETLDPRSKIELRDRKGRGMAIGPAGISVGVLDHLVLGTALDKNRSANAFKENSLVQVYPEETQTAQSYRVFRYGPSRRENRIDFGGEFLTLGNWTGISGAAFSTSLGWRTSLPLSLLAGLGNVRLTYWWNSGVKPIRGGPRENQWRQALSTAYEFLFSVQKSFFDEFLARYRGTARQWWPLSDGGHFENLGGYELIRRRLPVIVIIDAEADPDYTFEGLSNLVRKARLDFGAEIRFLSERELDNCLPEEIRQQFGTLEQLRRGVRSEQSAKDLTGSAPDNGQLKASPPRSIGRTADDALSTAHAALAEITYLNDGTKSQLTYIKPTLVGDEPADVHRYHTEHPSFPHETTLQQFFDEAQWESYRKLGEHIACKIFKEPTLKLFPMV